MRVAVLASALIFPASVVLAAGDGNYPDKPVNYIIPFGPGGESDITAPHQQPTFKALFKKDLIIS